MKVLVFILRKEFRQIVRDKTILVMMFAMPTIQLVIFPLATNFEVKNVNLTVVDHDHSTYSQKLITKIGSSGYFRIIAAEPSYKRALVYIEKEKADLLMEIPEGFERNLVREGVQKISLSVDAINGTKAFIGGGYLNNVIRDFNQEIRAGFSPGPAPVEHAEALIEISTLNWYNPLAEYKYYMVPGILVLLLTMIGGFIAALNIVREKEIGTIEQINVTPVKKWQFIMGKLIPFWLIGIIVFTLGLIVSWLVYGIVSVGSLLVLYSFAAIYLIALLGFGLLISTYSDSQVQAMFVAFFFVMIFTLMSGLFTSADSMPTWARYISNLTPVTHFIKAVRMVVLKGSGFADVKMPFLYILCFAVVLNGWAIYNYKKTS